ncbi:hypothetical protein [Siccirubricoccus sp. G192]|uniref:hypothetical protein n=1 Tax=Siccirubricoccus sp. G192 TaxID=2849651 RepID=UPI001C2C6BCB|nr:hypothetical protein [Siccirubricoccus sp. G192]MBV1797763.1 hypothetical protein [Siccirubricoccus sp. G192]
MVLSLLLDGRFDAYFEAARKDAGTWLFVHVPKTAGSSLSSELAGLIPPYHNIHIDHLDRSRPGPERYDAAVDAFLAEAGRTPFRSASGHIQNRHMERIRAALPGLRCVTMLRRPMSRIVSDYRYQRSPMHPLNEEVRRRVPDFAAFTELPGQRNRMARHLVPAEMVRREQVEDSIGYIMERYAFIGLQESYALSFRALTALVAGQPHNPQERRRVNEDGEAVVPTLDAMRRVQELNILDFAIHEFFARHFQAIEARLAAWLAAHPAGMTEGSQRVA